MNPRQLASELSFDFLIKKREQRGFIVGEPNQTEFMADLIIKFCAKKLPVENVIKCLFSTQAQL